MSCLFCGFYRTSFCHFNVRLIGLQLHSKISSSCDRYPVSGPEVSAGLLGPSPSSQSRPDRSEQDVNYQQPMKRSTGQHQLRHFYLALLSAFLPDSPIMLFDTTVANQSDPTPDSG